MNYQVVHVSEWLYPDVREYASGTAEMAVHAPRGGYAAAQVILFDTAADQPISVSGLEGLECCRQLASKVTYNTGSYMGPWTVPEGSPKPDYATRQAPFSVYDCLQPFSEGGNTSCAGVTALYFALPIARDAAPQVLRGTLEIAVGAEKVQIPYAITVHRAQLPEKETLKITVTPYPSMFSSRYGLKEYSPEWYEMYEKMLRLMRRARNSHNIIRLNMAKITDDGQGHYTFDFTEVKKVIDLSLRVGFTGLELDDICRKDYNKNDIYYLFYKPEGRWIPADSPEGYNFLAQFLPAWAAFLKENGYWDISMQHVGDEPNENMAANYRIICGIVRKFMPGMKLFNAVSVPSLRGALDCWIPLNCDYQHHMDTYESFREGGDELWFYTACGPGGKWLNRLMDQELLRPRLLHWGNYRYNLAGYLHWAFAYWAEEDLYENSHSIINDGTTLLPAGDTHICYPGNANGPWMSIRAEAMRLGAEDFELLRLIAARDQAKADVLCQSVLRSFDDYTTDIALFEKTYESILHTLDQIMEG